MERGHVIRRLPPLRQPNRWARARSARRAAGLPEIDLTLTDPARAGLAGTDPAVLAALADPAGLRYDPDPLGAPAARDAVAAYYAARGIPLDPAHVVLTSGTSEAYAHLFRLLAAPGECLLVPEPSYPLFGPIAALEGVRLEPYRIAWDGAWHLDLGAFDRALGHDPRGVVVVQPHVPTGACLGEAERLAIESRCAARGIPLVSDEVFADFPWPPAEGPLPAFAGRDATLTFALSGLSKVCGLPQLKLSWIAVSGPAEACAAALEGLAWIADLFLSVGTPVQLALPALLETRPGFQRRVRERLAANLAALDSLEARAPAVSVRRGAGGWMAVLQLPAWQDGERWALDLLERGVVTHPGSFYDLEGEAFLVVGLLADPAEFARGLAHLEERIAAG